MPPLRTERSLSHSLLFRSGIGSAGTWLDNLRSNLGILYFDLSFCLATKRCMNWFLPSYQLAPKPSSEYLERRLNIRNVQSSVHLILLTVLRLVIAPSQESPEILPAFLAVSNQSCL